MIGEGIDGLFGYTVRMFVEPGIAVATSQGAYPTFNFHVAGYGGRLVTVPYENDREDPHALVELAQSRESTPRLPRQSRQSRWAPGGRQPISPA